MTYLDKMLAEKACNGWSRADVIRAMNDEDLAKLIDTLAFSSGGDPSLAWYNDAMVAARGCMPDGDCTNCEPLVCLVKLLGGAAK